LGLSRNKVAVPEGAAGTPPFWSNPSYKGDNFVTKQVLAIFLVNLFLIKIEEQPKRAK
jgi:hypothetical protein